MRAWVGVVCSSHAQRGVAGGFAQVCHGKATPLRRMAPGDGFLLYSPSTEMGGGEPLKAFTALGFVEGAETFLFDMGGGFVPYRRRIRYLDAAPAPIKPLLQELAFTQGRDNWGLLLRRGHFEIPVEDFRRIARAMKVAFGEDLGDIA